MGVVTAVMWVGLTVGGTITIEDEDLSELVLELTGGSIDVQQPELTVEERDAQAVRDGVSLYSIEEALDAYAALRSAGADDAMDRELMGALEARLASEVATKHATSASAATRSRATKGPSPWRRRRAPIRPTRGAFSKDAPRAPPGTAARRPRSR